jgi:uncharacterized RDD family membrane protein YckC
MTEPQDPYGAPDPDQPPPGYGQPPPPPPAYGTPPPPGYGQPAYGMPPEAPGYGGAMPELAGWGLRVQSALVDVVGPFVIADIVQYGVSSSLGQLLSLVAFAWALYNSYLAGTTGQSYGKKWAGTRLVRAQDGQLTGGGLAIGRYFVHIVDALPCLLGFLWPLWDAKRQTFADKILNTVVVSQERRRTTAAAAAAGTPTSTSTARPTCHGDGPTSARRPPPSGPPER